MPFDPELAVVIPVYNEVANLEALLRDWLPVFQATGVPYRFTFIDDGSKDDSLRLLRSLATNHPAVEIHTQPNAGHGPTILRGYHLAKNAEWVFQLDSDHQLDPTAFQQLWTNRSQYDLLLGQRSEEHASIGRRSLSLISGLVVRTLYGAGVSDANCPYRLMRGADLRQALEKIPPDSFAPNILITSWFLGKKKKIFTTVVEYRKQDRRASRMSGYMLRGALRSFRQTITFRWRT
jgi:dolichol-phosphate mannosyltransferase